MLVKIPLRPLRTSCRPQLLAVLALAALTTGGCASPRAQEAPGCAGSRRPANPHGSVLDTGDAPNTAPSPTGAGRCAGAPR